MDDINSLENSFKYLQQHSDEQFHITTSLQKEIDKLKTENKSLKLMLQTSNQNIEISSEQLICETQISILKDRAVQKELNADEVRRFAQLYEILEKIKKSAVNVDDVKVNQMSTEDLLKLVVINDNTK